MKNTGCSNWHQLQEWIDPEAQMGSLGLHFSASLTLCYFDINQYEWIWSEIRIIVSRPINSKFIPLPRDQFIQYLDLSFQIFSEVFSSISHTFPMV